MTFNLVRNPDILASVAALAAAPYTVGFAAETAALEERGRHKLESKKVDLIAANYVGEHQGFETEENSLLLIERDNIVKLPTQAKTKLARALIQHIAQRYRAKHGAKIHRLRS